MTTNCKSVKEVIRMHIQEYYTPEELKATVESIKCRAYPTNYHAVKHMAEDGSFLVYYGDVIDFLNSLGINPEGKEYSPEKSWKLYCHLIARDAELLIKKVN